MSTQLTVSRHVVDFVDPMCDATCRLLREETNLAASDYVLVSVEDYAYNFHDEDAATVATKRFVVKLRNRDATQIASYALRSSWWQRIPGATALTHGYGFNAPPSDTTALVMLAALGAERIEFEDEIAKLEFWNAALRFRKQTKIARAQAGYKQHRTIPNDVQRGKKGLPPMPHQQVAAWCAERSEAYALFMEQSTGKTYTAIMTIEAAHVVGQCQLVLIQCPKNVRTNWCNELRRFSKLRQYTVRLKGGKIERAKQLLEAFRAKVSGDFDVVYVILPFQTAVNSETHVVAYMWDWVLIDEAHSIKTPGAKRTKTALKLRDRAKRRLILTGTPIANHMFDLYSQLEFLGRGWSGFTSYDSFRKFYGSWESTGRGVERLVSLQNVPLLQERLARMSFLIKKTEAMPDLPPKTYDVIGVDMTSEQRAVYDSLATQLYAEIERDIAAAEAGGKTVTVTNILTRLLRLAQITSGFVCLDREIDPETDEFIGPVQIDRFDPNPKLEQLIECVDELDKDSKAIVWCCFIQDVKQIAARLALDGVECVTYYGAMNDDERDEAVRRFNEDPRCKVLVGNPTAGGVGLNLTGTCAQTWPQRCDTVFHYSQNWSAVTRAQGEERPRGYLHESVSPTGKRETWSIRNVDLCVEDSVDMQIRQRVTSKRQHAAKIQDVRELLRSLIGRAPAETNDEGEDE